MIYANPNAPNANVQFKKRYDNNINDEWTPPVAGVWNRNVHDSYRFGRSSEAGCVWTNCYQAYPAHAALDGHKQSGIGRENYKVMLSHDQQTKNLLMSYSPDALGFF